MVYLRFGNVFPGAFGEDGLTVGPFAMIEMRGNSIVGFRKNGDDYPIAFCIGSMDGETHWQISEYITNHVDEVYNRVMVVSRGLSKAPILGEPLAAEQ